MNPAFAETNVSAGSARALHLGRLARSAQRPFLPQKRVPSQTGGRRMMLDPVESTLATGDYHRLGVRESEARARVIRHAAHQLAEPLVRRNLQAPDVQTEADLVQVVTSTYRLLDPRRRATAVERALLAQQEPVRAVEPRWAHPKALAGRKTGVSAGMQFNTVDFESLPADSSTLFPEPKPPRIGGPTVGVALSRLASCHNYLRRYRPTSWPGRWALWVGPVAFILLLLAIRPMLKDRAANSAPPTSAAVPENSSGDPASRGPESKTQPASPTVHAESPRVASASSVEADPAKDAPPKAILQAGWSAADAPGIEVDAPEKQTESNEMVREAVAADDTRPAEPAATGTADEPLDDESSSSDPAASEVAEAEKNEGTGSANDPGAARAGVETAEDEPKEEATQQGKSEIAEAEPEQQPQARVEPLKAPPRHAPLPSPAELKRSQSRLQDLLADRPKPVTETQQRREVEWLLDLRKDSAPGSANALAIAQLTVAKLVAAGRYEQAAAIVDELEGQFEAQDAQLARSTTEQLVESAASLSDHRRIVAWCLMLSEKYLQAELFDAANELTRLGTISAVKLGDSDLRSRLSQRRDAISTARRTSESVWKITKRSSPEDATAADAAQAGRYLCLMIRDWGQGVVWLANGADSRLAAAAQQELLLNKPPENRLNAEDDRPAVDGGTVASQWLEASDRFRGRLGESAKLHAYELISQAMEESAGLRTLELKKQLETLREQIPEDILPRQDNTAPAAKRPAGGAGGQQAMAASSVMEGRLTLQGRDTGTLVRYSPGVQLRQNVLEQIFQALQRPVTPWTLTFEGILRLEKAATVRIIATGPAAPDGQTTVRINSNRLTLADSVRGRSTTVDLAAGTHRVTWQISGEQLDEAFVLLQDEVSGERLELTAPPTGLNQLPSRLRINIQRAP